MSSSPWMRGAPQVGFSATIRKMRSRTSFEVSFLPTFLLALEINLQYKRKPARCQRTTVSGVTPGFPGRVPDDYEGGESVLRIRAGTGRT